MVNEGPSHWVLPKDTSSIQLIVVKENHQIENLLDLCTLSRGPDGRTQKLDLTHVSPWNETTILSLGIESHQIPDVLLFRFWTCDFSNFWDDSAALDEALPKWIISKATGICNSREQMYLIPSSPERLFGATSCYLLETFWLWFFLVMTVYSHQTAALLPKRDRHEG